MRICRNCMLDIERREGKFKVRNFLCGYEESVDENVRCECCGEYDELQEVKEG